MTDIVERLTREKCDYDTRCYAASEIAILRIEKQKLREEITRLRAALEKISLMDKVHEHDLFSATCVARAALAEEKKDE
jgi:hypothetical protein